MAVTTTNLGVITAYGDAVAAGYTGTKAEWQTLMASYATVGQQAVDAKNDAVAAKDIAVQKATDASTAAGTATQKANEASASAQSIAQSASQITQNTSDISELKEDFTQMESDGVVPSAEQIISDKGITDSVPYHYRKTGGNGADRLYDQIVGGTVNWNQLIATAQKTFTNPAADTRDYVSFRLAHGSDFVNVASVSAVGIVRVIVAPNFSGTSVLKHSGASQDLNFATNIEIISGHKYYVNVDFLVVDPTTVGGISTQNQMLFDLTAMFGSTIADYIYNLEQTTAGAGVAFFKNLFPNDYYSYNAGELKSVEGLSAHKMVGFNQWDEEWEQGYISNTGELQNNGYYFRSKNYIPIFPETTYFYKCPADYSDYARFAFYDADKRFLSYVGTSSYIDWTFTTPANAHYMKFTTGEKLNKSGVSYRGDICINLSDPAKNGEYEPYKAHSYPLDSTLTLRGLFKLDANNQLYADGDTYDADGTVTRKYGIVDLGTRNWASQAATSGRYEMISNSLVSVAKKTDANTKAGNIICKAYPTIPRDSVYAGSIGISLSTSGYLCVYDPNYGQNDAATFKTAMSGVMLVYELATPTTEEAEPYQHLQQCDPNGTEEYVSTGIVPVGHNSFYPENLRAKVEQLPWNFASLIAPTEATFTATRNYTTGSLFIVGNVLYKATSNIANGGVITPNTNCTATTLAEIISALA